MVGIQRNVLAVYLAVLMSCVWAVPVSAQSLEWSLDPSWTVSAGDGQGEGHQLLHVQDAVLLEDGRLAVLSSGTKDIRVFSQDGGFERAVGREGEGPGEFKVPNGLRLLPSGHLLVYDSGNLRVTEFDAGFEVVGTVRVAFDMTEMAPAFGRSRPMANGFVPVASYSVPFFESARRAEGVYEDDLVVRLFEGTDVRASVRRPRGAMYTAKDGTRGLKVHVPMGESVLFNWGPGQVVMGSSHSTEVDVYDTSGVLAHTVRAAGELRPVTRKDMAAFDERFRRERGGSMTILGTTVSRDVQVERFLDDAPRGDQMPLFDKVEIDDEGRVWVREYALDSEVVTWQLTAESGPVARIVMPAAWEVLQISERHVIVKERDEYDVEMVRVYRVVS